VSSKPPEGWDEIFRGSCLEADLVQAILEARGLQVVAERLGPESVFAGLAFEQCRLFVRSMDGEVARQVLAERRDEGPEEGPEGGGQVPP
jgi:hypothetical protein